jgi:hypothetical protein
MYLQHCQVLVLTELSLNFLDFKCMIILVFFLQMLNFLLIVTMAFFKFLREFIDPFFGLDELLAQICQLVTHQSIVIIADISLTLEFSEFFLQVAHHIIR